MKTYKYCVRKPYDTYMRIFDKTEYKENQRSIDIYISLEDWLSNYGLFGWELIHVSGKGVDTEFIFKQEI